MNTTNIQSDEKGAETLMDGATPDVPERFTTLDGIRGVAAVLVVWFHLSQQDLMPAVGSPFLAVDLFFGLSGFVLGLAYDRKLAAGLTAAAFMKKRIIRLYPMYAIGLAIGTVAVLTHAKSIEGSDQSFAIATVLNLLLIPAFHASSLLFPANVAAWSLFF